MGKTVYTTIYPALSRKLLVKGTLLAACGVICLIALSFFHLETLSFFSRIGLFGFFLFLICLGMIPYRAIQRVETIPHTLTVEGDTLVYRKGRKAPLRLPLKEVASISYSTRGELYGIILEMKKGAPFFFPYFSEKSANALLDYVVHSKEPKK